MIGAVTFNSVALGRISEGNQGVLGGPAVFGSTQVAGEQASLGVGIQNGLPEAPVLSPEEGMSPGDLSTGSLDGAKIAQKSTKSDPQAAAAGSGSAGDNPPVEAKNQNVLEATAALASKQAPAPAAPKPKASRYFIQPASGHNWGVLHNRNGIDIANSCGTPVVAAAAGTVVSDPSLGSGVGGWNGGYGNFVIVAHPNGMKTRYAHLSRILVSIGEEVEQGQQIGRIGNTGKVRGKTGCHLHFEVIGGTNPFAR